MKKTLQILFLLLFISCYKAKETKLITKLPKKVNEVSGIETTKNSNLIWMHNDSGNKSKLYAIDLKGKIKSTINIKAKNNDWEDLTTDDQGNIYIADFGNNDNDRKNLVILKVANHDLDGKKNVEIEKIKFSYPNQYKFPPKKQDRFFDAESIFWFKNNLYIFTKSRVKGAYGKTKLYKIPAKKGNHIAEFISEFNTCNKLSCSITAADISPNGKKVALLNHTKVLVFSDFTSDNFFNGKLLIYDLGFKSQKEGLVFKNNNVLYISDEKAHGKGGNLYEFNLN